MSVIVVTWNAGDVLGGCLDSLAEQRVAGGFETIVVDSGSTDGTAELLRGRGGVTVISKTENVGFSAGNNEAASIARGDVLVFLNSDTALLGPDVLERLARAARRPGVGLAGPRLENPDGSLQPSCAAHPGVLRALLVMSGLDRLLPGRLRARVVPERWPHDAPRDTGWLMGAALAVRADLFAAAGGFWPRLYAEDEDLAYRLKQRGLVARYEPAARVMHIGNHSLAQRLSGRERAARVTAAEVAFMRAHYARGRALAIRAILAAGHALRAVAHTLLGDRERAAVYRAMASVYVSGDAS